jgi:dihydrofolate reductase
MRIALIVATDLDGVIGRDNQLPWHLPADLQSFKRLTMGKPLIMGRKTYVSIGKPLPGRTSIVLTAQGDFVAPGCLVAHSVEEAMEIAALALAAARAEHGVQPQRPTAAPESVGTAMAAAAGASPPDEAMVIGGAAVFRAFWPLATRLYWTQVRAHVGGDVHLPGIVMEDWGEVESTTHLADDKHAWPLRFLVLERVGPPGGPCREGGPRT